jgi:hypothetical protein
MLIWVYSHNECWFIYIILSKKLIFHFAFLLLSRRPQLATPLREERVKIFIKLSTSSIE